MEYDIELPKTRLKYEVNDETIEDIPSKEEIKKGLGYANIQFKAIILFISSSGMAQVDVRKLTYHDFLKSLSEYVDIDVNEWIDIKELDKKLQEKDTIILPCFKGKRSKTKERFITFCTPEALESLLEYLKSHPPKHLEDPLFRTKSGKPLTGTFFSQSFQRFK